MTFWWSLKSPFLILICATYIFSYGLFELSDLHQQQEVQAFGLETRTLLAHCITLYCIELRCITLGCASGPLHNSVQSPINNLMTQIWGVKRMAMPWRLWLFWCWQWSCDDEYDNDRNDDEDDESEAWISNLLTVCSDRMSGIVRSVGHRRREGEGTCVPQESCNW